MRNHAVRALTKLPGALAHGEKLWWIPDAHYDTGFFADPGHRAVGWQIPQPWVIDAEGFTRRLDDILDGHWTVVHTGALPAGAHAWIDAGATVIRLAGPHDATIGDGVRDTGATLIDWMADKNATALVVRPDGFVYGAATSGHPLPAPPAGLTLRTARASITPIRNGATA